MNEQQKRLEELRTEVREGTISYGEITELQSLIPNIPNDDMELLEAAGVPEFPESEESEASGMGYAEHLNTLE